MLKGSIVYLDDSPRTPVVIGVGEDVKAPRDLAVLEKNGWIIDDGVTIAYKAWLAGKRQGDIPKDSRFDEWVDNVAEVELRPSRKQIEQAVALGSMDAEQAEKLLSVLETEDEGEAGARHGE